MKQTGYLPSQHPPCKRRALPLLRSRAEVPSGEPWGTAEALTSMTSTSALVKSMFSSLGRGTPAPSTPVGHKPAQLSAAGGGVPAELLPGAWSPAPSSLCANPSLHERKALRKGFVSWDLVHRQNSLSFSPARVKQKRQGARSPGGPLLCDMWVRLLAKCCHLK